MTSDLKPTSGRKMPHGIILAVCWNCANWEYESQRCKKQKVDRRDNESCVEFRCRVPWTGYPNRCDRKLWTHRDLTVTSDGEVVL